MAFEHFLPFIPWDTYSKKIKTALAYPYLKGTFKEEEASLRGMRLSTSEKGKKENSLYYKMFLLIDKEDGICVDARYIFFGPTSLQAVLEISLQFVIGKNYDQIKRITEDILEKEIGIKKEEKKGLFFLESIKFVLEGMYRACERLEDIPLSPQYIAPPKRSLPEGGGGLLVENFMSLSLKEKLAAIESVLDTDIRPYIAMDGGGVSVINLIADKELIIAYEGNCTSCFSSVGATLSYIQETLQNRVHPDLFVTPQF